MTKSKFSFTTIIIILVGILAFFLILSSLGAAPKEETTTNEKLVTTENTESEYSEFVSNLQAGGPPKDGIPPIDEPEYQTINDADKDLDPKDVVFVIDYKGTVKIYPQNILVWHEIVNEEIKGEKLTLSYCPLTGSTIGYKGDIKEHSTTYGTSGKLLNSNLVMYDRATDSYIPQVLGTGITGDLKGERLDTFPIYWTRWELAKAKYPNAEVLTRDTGFFRNYNKDPYGSYLESGNYYDSQSTLFPLMHTSGKIGAKEVVIGVRGESAELAILKSKLKDKQVANLKVGNESVVALYDESLDIVRVFKRGDLEFSLENGQITDLSGETWDVKGLSSSGKQLEWIDSFDVMWFAWYAYFPQTTLYPDEQ